MEGDLHSQPFSSLEENREYFSIQHPKPPATSSAQEVAPGGRQEGRWKGQMKKAVAGLWLTPNVTSSL